MKPPKIKYVSYVWTNYDSEAGAGQDRGSTVIIVKYSLFSEIHFGAICWFPWVQFSFLGDLPRVVLASVCCLQDVDELSSLSSPPLCRPRNCRDSVFNWLGMARVGAFKWLVTILLKFCKCQLHCQWWFCQGRQFIFYRQKLAPILAPMASRGAIGANLFFISQQLAPIIGANNWRRQFFPIKNKLASTLYRTNS